MPPLPIQYADYAIWERSAAHLAQVETQLVAWKEHLAGVPTLSLPTDRPRPSAQSTQGARSYFVLDDKLTSALQSFVREQRLISFMVLLSGFGALLSRYSGQRVFAIGTPVAHRTQIETESVVGFFANTLAMKLNFEGEPSVRECLGRVKEETLLAFAHEDVPFERLVEQLPRDTSRSPLFQAMLVLQNAPFEGVTPTSAAGAILIDPGTPQSSTFDSMSPSETASCGPISNTRASSRRIEDRAYGRPLAHHSWRDDAVSRQASRRTAHAIGS